MKISLITLHRIVNYGSALQTYATQKVFETLGLETEIVDYYTERMTLRGMSDRIRHKSPRFEKSRILTSAAQIIMYPSYVRRFKVFTEFARKNFHLTTHTYTSALDFDRHPIDADFYCTGSDQVWNSIWNEKFDAPFYLSYAPDDKPKFSYAASFGRTQLEEWEIEPTRRLLSRYDNIAMRESSGVDVLNTLGLSGRHVLDPTLLLTYDQWKPLISDRYANDAYILVYNINREKGLDAFAQKLAKKTGLKVYFMSYYYHDFYKKGKLICSPDVCDFLGLIAHAKYVITDSFHCTAFSINFNKQLMVYYPHKFSTRLQSIVKLVEQENRVITEDSPVIVADEAIDFEKTNQILAAERAQSLGYLKTCLDTTKEHIGCKN